jgi:hypothetical protein
MEIMKNPNITYEDSILKKYYSIFHPINTQEIFFGDSDHEIVPLNQGFVSMPWLKITTQILKKRLETRRGGNHFFGPNTDEFGQLELKRLKRVFEQIKNNGYEPEIYPDGFVIGYMLQDKDDYRFIVSEGQHRMAVLAALGYKKILCKFHQQSLYPKVVKYNNLTKWSGVKEKKYSKQNAQKLFNRFFELDGSERACKLGLWNKG